VASYVTHRTTTRCVTGCQPESEETGFGDTAWNKFICAQVSEETLHLVKLQMNRSFEAHAVNPEDPGYVYNLQQDFPAKDEGVNDWDDDSDMYSMCPQSTPQQPVAWDTIMQETKLTMR
jgi:hypothetical protein